MTYKRARLELYNYFRQAGWKHSDPKLKVPWVQRPSDGLKFWFKAQSVHYGTDRPTLSLHVDMRDIETAREAIITGAR